MATKPSHVMAIDQGTTGSTVLVFDRRGRIVGRAYSEFRQHYPKPGWVEHDAEEIWRVTLRVARRRCGAPRVTAAALAAIGITNQRETDGGVGPAHGRADPPRDRVAGPPHRRRAARELKDGRARGDGARQDRPRARRVLLRHQGRVDARARARTPARAPSTATSSSARSTPGSSGSSPAAACTRPTRRTRRARCSTTSTRAPGIRSCCACSTSPRTMLPEVRPSSGVIAETEAALLGAAVPIAGVAGDQQAALFGQACFAPGMVKNTYGTGCFVLMQTGPWRSRASAASSPRSRAAATARRRTRSKGSVFIAGAAIQWLRDGLKILRTAAESERLARSVDSTLGVYLVPAFVGLGAPYWDPEARGAIVGLTRGVDARARRARRARVARVPDARRRRDHGGRGRPSDRSCCASTAARRPTTS